MSSGSGIGSWRVVRELSEGRSFEAIDETGRRVVLKVLESDCLLGGQIHPMIKDRLCRVRELAHLGVANLLGAEREGARVYLAWEHVEGRPLEELLAENPACSGDLRRLGGELVRSVESLHALGIVHGALHARNVIVRPAGGLKLTHISPLLYSDPAVDVEGVLEILEAMGCRPELEEAEGQMPSLRQIGTALEAGGQIGPGAGPGRREDRRLRWGALIGALLAAAAGAGLTWGLWRFASRYGQEQARGVEKRDEMVRAAEEGLGRAKRRLSRALGRETGWAGAWPSRYLAKWSGWVVGGFDPHPNPLPEYRERGQERSLALPIRGSAGVSPRLLARESPLRGGGGGLL